MSADWVVPANLASSSGNKVLSSLSSFSSTEVESKSSGAVTASSFKGWMGLSSSDALLQYFGNGRVLFAYFRIIENGVELDLPCPKQGYHVLFAARNVHVKAVVCAQGKFKTKVQADVLLAFVFAGEALVNRICENSV